MRRIFRNKTLKTCEIISEKRRCENKLVIEVTSATPERDATQPTLRLEFRIENTWGWLLLGGIATFEVFYAASLNNRAFVGKSVMHIPSIGAGRTAKTMVKLPFSAESMYYLDKYRPQQSDVNFSFFFEMTLIYKDTDVKVTQTQEQCEYRVSLSDWSKFSYPSFILLPVSAENMKRLEELKKGHGFKNLDDVVDEVYGHYFSHRAERE